jgi:hypothetical protein
LGIFELELLALRLLCAIREQIAQGIDDLCICGQLLFLSGYRFIEIPC